MMFALFGTQITPKLAPPWKDRAAGASPRREVPSETAWIFFSRLVRRDTESELIRPYQVFAELTTTSDKPKT